MDQVPQDEDSEYELTDRGLRIQTVSSRLRIRNDNPLQINPIIRCIFGYLNLANLKECRKVNKMWNSEAEPFITKRSRVIFGEHILNGKSIARTPKDFCEAFPVPETAGKFTSFFILDGDGYPIFEINNFFEKQKKFITELQFDGIYLYNDDGNKLETYDIQDWIKDSPINRFRIQRSWNTIQLGSYFHTLSLLTVPLRHLKNVQNLNLQDHRIEIESGIRISPRKLEISKITILKDGMELKECRINDFIKFEENSKVSLRYSNPTTLIVDFGEYFMTNNINLRKNTKIMNWKISRCIIDTLVMHDVPVLEKTGMKVKNLKLSTISIDFVALPKDLETLRLFVYGEQTPILCSEPIFLPKLRFVMIDSWHSAALGYFANCPNLVEVYIHCSGGNSNLYLNSIPTSVKKLKIHGYLKLEGSISVETLLIYLSNLSDAARILNQIKTNILVLHLSGNKKHNLEDELVPFLQNNQDITIYVGPIPSFRSLNLTEYVDKESEFYIFQQQKGKGISEREFYDILFPKRF